MTILGKKQFQVCNREFQMLKIHIRTKTWHILCTTDRSLIHQNIIGLYVRMENF